MDTFFEQIVPMKKTGKDIALIVLIWFLALCIAAAAFLFLSALPAFAVLAAGLVFYGAYRLSKRFFVEFEYIVTNTTLDIDKITAKSSRKRIVSIEIPEITSVEKFNPNGAAQRDGETRIISCDPADSNAYMLSVKGDRTTLKIVLSPNDRIKEGLLKALPKYIANSAFRG